MKTCISIKCKIILLFLLVVETTRAQRDTLSQIIGESTLDFASIDSTSIKNDSIKDIPNFEISFILESAPYQVTSQGGACFQDYLVVGVNANRCFNIYDKNNGKLISSVPIHTPKPDNKCHANTINFGKDFFSPEDEMPLLYVSSGFGDATNNQSHIYVYRLAKNKKAATFEASLVQDITLAFSGWTECVTDNIHDALWVRRFHKKAIEFLKFEIPDFKIDKITLDLNDAQDSISTYDFIAQKHTQGFIYHNEHIHYVTGIPGPKEACYLIDFNLETRDYERVTILDGLGMTNRQNPGYGSWEPEYVYFSEGDLFVGYRSFVCKINQTSIKEAHNYKTLFERMFK